VGNITIILETIKKIIELESLIETEIRKVSNVKRRKKFKKLCAAAIKEKDISSLDALRDYLFKL